MTVMKLLYRFGLIFSVFIFRLCFFQDRHPALRSRLNPTAGSPQKTESENKNRNTKHPLFSNLSSINRLFIIMAFLILCSCSSWDGTPASPPGPTYPPGPTHPPGSSCLAKILSKDECFFNLPTMAHGEPYTWLLKDPLNLETTGVVVGKGEWICQHGVWKALYPRICLGCNPGHSVKHCMKELDRLVEKEKRGAL